MSALSFKINAETDKLNSFIASLDRLKTVLGDIPSGTKEFDVINRKIAEMEARVEQSMKKIAQMQGEATRAVEQAASAGSSASGVQATKEDNVAYHELLETLKAVNASKEENIALISRYQAQIVKLKTDIKDLNEAERRGKQLTDAQKSSRFAAAVSVEEYKQAISRARKELANQIKLEQVARGSIDEMSQALSRMRAVYRSLNESERGSGWGQTLLKNIETLDAKIKGLDASMGVHARNVGNYASGFNMLGFQIQQVAREFPALAYGPQVFFAAISNNLPMLADEIARAKKQVKELKNAGESFTPVWKQIASSLISWQTLLVAGVTVLTLYGKEIVGWVGSLFKGKQALDAAKVAADQFHATMTEGTVAAQAELAKLDLIYKAATDLSKPYEERAEAVKKLQDIYPAYFGNMAAEQVMVGNAVGAYEGLRDAIIEVAEAKAAENIITKNREGISLIEATGDAYTKYKRALDALSRTQKAYNKVGSEYALSDVVESEQAARRELKRARKLFEQELSKLSGGKELWERIESEFDGNINSFEETINAAIERLAPSAEKLYTGKTPQELNAAANKARQEAENAARKAAAQQERDQKELEKTLEKLRDDALQSEIDSMQDGTAKKIAQINFDYRKRAKAIQEAEKQIIKLKGQLTSEEEAQFASLRKANQTQQAKDWTDTFFAPIFNAAKEGQQAWNDYLIQYGTFQEKIQATKDKYDKKLKEAQTEGDKATIKAERDRALAELEAESSSWAKDLINKTVRELEDIQTQLEAELEAAEQTFNALETSSTPEAKQLLAQINKLKAQLKALTPQINKAKKAASDNDWAKGALALNAIADGAREALNGVRDLDEGLANALETLVNIAGSAGSFADSIKGIKGGDLSFGSIAGAITSGIGLISSIAGLFKGGETSMERNIRLAKEFNEELRIMNEQAKINSDAFSSIFGDNAWGNYANNINVLNEAASKYGDTLERVKKRGKEVAVDFGEYGGRANLKKVDKTWENATESVANMLVQTRHSTWFRSAKYKSLKDLLPELFEGDEINMENLKKFVDSNNDTFKHLGRENQEYLKGMVADWEIYQQAVEAVNDYLTDMLGDLGSSLTDALVDSFESGTDAAEAFGEAVGDMLKNMAKQVLYNATLAPLIDEAQSQIEEINKNSALSNEDRFNAYTKVIGDLMDQVLAEQEAGQDLWERLQKMAEEKGIDWTEETASGQTATSRGFQVMSQDTGDELNGRFTDIQGKVTDIRGFVMSNTMQIVGILSTCQHIELIQIEGLQVNQELLRHAVMTYLEIVEINGTTKEMNKTLKDMRDDIASIKRNTSEL